jgi:hypothetical protein
MNVFQTLSLSVVLGALLVEAVRTARARRMTAAGLIRGLTWAAAAVAIRFPGLVQASAVRLGIHRGTDLVLYVFVMTCLFVWFYLYARYRTVQRQVTELIRRHAIEHALCGPRGDPDDVAWRSPGGEAPPPAARDEVRPDLGRIAEAAVPPAV